MSAARVAVVLAAVAVVLSGAAYFRAQPPAPSADMKPAVPAVPAPPADSEHAGYTPGLGEIMTLQQMRHAKLAVAGANSNWALADYELDELNEGFDDIVTFHPTHKDIKQPLTEMVPGFMKASIDDLREAIKAKDAAKFNTAFDAVTTGCNGCHQAADFGFNVVIKPATAPYPNQQFTPAK